MESKIAYNKIAYDMSSNEHESSTHTKQIYDELIQENNYHIKIRNKKKQIKIEQTQQIKIPAVDKKKRAKRLKIKTKN